MFLTKCRIEICQKYDSPDSGKEKFEPLKIEFKTKKLKKTRFYKTNCWNIPTRTKLLKYIFPSSKSAFFSPRQLHDWKLHDFQGMEMKVT